MSSRIVGIVVSIAAWSAFAQWPSVDDALPRQAGGENDAALLIAVEDYAYLPDLSGARANAVAWANYLTKTRGVPLRSLVFLSDSDASLEGIEDGLKRAVDAVKSGGSLWILFIGHGAPSRDGKEGVLVGVDAQQSERGLYARSINRSAIFDALQRGRQAHAYVFIDACFSGVTESQGALLAGSMPTLPERERKTPPASVVLLTAGTNWQFARRLPGGNRPAFSYLALGGLRGWADEDRDGFVTASEIIGFSTGVLRSTVTGDRPQTPTLDPESAAQLILGPALQPKPPVLDELPILLHKAAAPSAPPNDGLQSLLERKKRLEVESRLLQEEEQRRAEAAQRLVLDQKALEEAAQKLRKLDVEARRREENRLSEEAKKEAALQKQVDAARQKEAALLKRKSELERQKAELEAKRAELEEKRRAAGGGP